MTRNDPVLAKLPIQQLTILAICRFAEPVASTSVYPYLPEMIQSFNVEDDKVATYAGWMSAVFSLSQCLTAIAWGRASDVVGRKPMIIIALTCIMAASVCFGFSTSLGMAFAFRAVQGLSSGNVGIIRTAVAEMVPQKELQPRAFSVMPLVWNIGSIFGPMLGGGLVTPVKRYPGLFGNSTLLKRFPFALPNIVISVLFAIGILSGIFFLYETHEDRKKNRDYGIILGRFITRPCTKRPKSYAYHAIHEEEAEPFLEENRSALSSPMTPRAKPLPKKGKPPGWRDVFSYQSNINLIVYTGLAMHSVAFDQIVPVFLHYPSNDALRSKQPIVPPFRFAGGFGLASDRIGLIFTVYGVFGMFVQFLAFPPIARRYGVLNCFKACVVVFPLTYLALPFTSLIATDSARTAVLLAIMLVKCCCSIFAFPCSTILLTNSAASLKILGTLNGVATSVSAVGRGAGPALAGAAFTAGVDAGYIIVPFWTLAAISIVAAIPVWWLVEMEGFSARKGKDDKDDDDVDNDDDDDDDDEDDGTYVGGDEDDEIIGWMNRQGRGDRIQGEEEQVDNPPPLPLPSQMAGLGVQGSEEAADLVPEEFPKLSLSTSRLSRSSTRRSGFVSGPASASATTSQVAGAGGTSQAIPSPKLLRRTSSSPIGTGIGVVTSGARRFSSDLGTSRSGMGTGGTSFH